jgi:hydrogenase-4 component B
MAAVLAFVGAVSAFSLTRSFGLAFLGTPREPAREASGGDPPASMLGPMVLHALGVVLLGLAPEVIFGVLRTVVKLFPIRGTAEVGLEPVAAVVWAGRLLAAALAVVGLVAWRRGVKARRSVTWGCGYTAATSRMQYTGAAFVEHFARVFDAFLPSVRREKLPGELFPQQPGHLATHHADPVEKRMFEVLGQGEDFVTQASGRIPEQPRFAFAAGLVAVVILGALVAGAVVR